MMLSSSFAIQSIMVVLKDTGLSLQTKSGAERFNFARSSEELLDSIEWFYCVCSFLWKQAQYTTGDLAAGPDNSVGHTQLLWTAKSVAAADAYEAVDPGNIKSEARSPMTTYGLENWAAMCGKISSLGRFS